jgi:UDP-glucose 4-epimerase
MRALVTGGAGFIGSHLADRLLADGHEVTVLDNESTGFRHNVPAGARYIKGDVARGDELDHAFEERLDAVFHIAGQASTIRSFSDPTDDLRTNVQGTIRVLQRCLEHRVGRLLYASSMTAYGHPVDLPVGESTPLAPVSYYGISKMAAERYVHASAARNDLDFEFHVTSFRMFNVYGERQSLTNPYQGVVAIFIANLLRGEPIAIFGDGEQSRDFVHISDVVDAWMLALNSPAAHEQVFNLGTGTRRSVHALIDAVLAARGLTRAGYDIRYDRERPGDQRHMQADISKIQEVLGWRPKVDFSEGMARTVAWAEEVGVRLPG